MKGFKYDKFKSEANSNDSWGSYSDLFMVLSFVFLMMYVTASLRSGTNSIAQRLERQQVARENADLKAQMKAYDTLKDQALKEESQDEQEVYKELMDKLSLLQEEQNEEKQKLRLKAMENEKKEMALNRYQQVVRNIINANMLAKSKLKVREEIIDRKNVTITDLNQEVKEKKQEIAQNNQQIAKINNELNKNIANLKKAQVNSKITKEKAFAQIQLLKKKSLAQIAKLNKENKDVQVQLAQINQELSQTSQQLAKTETANQELSEELTETTEKLENTVGEYEAQIANIQNTHAARMAREKQAFDQKIKTANITASEKARQLAEFNRQAQAKNAAMNQQIASLQTDLQDAESREQTKALEAQQLAGQLAATSDKLQKTVGDYQNQIKNLQNANAQKMAQERAAFEGKLAAANMTAAEKARQLGEFNRAAQEKERAAGQQIANLRGELQGAAAREAAKGAEAQRLAGELGRERAAFEGKLAAANLSAAEKGRQLAEFNRAAKEKSDALGKEITGLQGELAEAQARANARAKLSKEIAEALRKAGVGADVNPNTGDVTISFDGDYFDSGSSTLKPTMANVLQKFVPKYSESLFKDPKIASKITSVDIVGFASPTYQNRYIDPKSLNPEDQKAAQYNLDLSYKRARAIFDYMFDTRKINYENQKDLLGLVKVTGRSFFTEGRAPAGAMPGMSQKEFCSKFDCKQAQKVIIKFNMDDKK